MAASIEKLKAKLEKAEAAKKKAVRQAQLLTAKLGKQERRRDTRRKILDGALIETEALNNPEAAALLDRLRRVNLMRDDDRALFGFEALSDLEKMARGIPLATGKPGRKAKSSGAVAAAAHSDNAADATPEGNRAGEIEPMDKRESEAA